MYRKIRMLAITILFALSVFISGTAMLTSNRQVFASVVWSDVVLEESYIEGAEFSVPSRTLTVGGEEVSADFSVTFPDGTTTINKNITLNKPGEYTIKYTAYTGKVYSVEEKFTVKYKLISNYSEETTYQYGAHALAPNVEGLMVRLAEYDKLMFNPIIDMSSKTKTDTLFEFFVTPNEPGFYDFEKLFIQFTDISNEENFLKVRFIRSLDGIHHAVTYALAGGNDQPMEGYEESRNIIHIDNNRGSTASHNFAGITYTGETDVGRLKVRLSYDANEKIVYMNDKMIIDLDSSQFYTSLWNGFDSGKVKMTLWATDYLSSTANFVITQGPDGIDLSKKNMEETTPPVVTVDTEYEASAMPMAKVGLPYSIPYVSAYDDYSGVCAVETKVYYNYLTSPSGVNIENGKFTPKYSGLYAIVYTAKDYMGNEGTQILWVNCSENLAKPTVILKGALPSQATAGEWINFPTYEVEGGSGESEIKIYVNDGKSLVEYTDGFRLNRAGTHTVIFQATDYIGQVGETSVQINAIARTAPVFIDIPNMPKYLIGGANYVLPDVYANDYSNGELIKRLATVTVTDANGQRQLAAGENYVPYVENNFDIVNVTYQVDEVTYALDFPTVKAKDENGVYASNYFDFNGATMSLQDEYGVVTATKANASWTFANVLIAEGFRMKLTANVESEDYKGLKIVFVDSIDESISISAQIIKKENAAAVLTESANIDIEAGFTEAATNKNFIIEFSNGNFIINDLNVGISKTDNGELFKGFTSEKIYVSVAFIEAEAGAKYNIAELNTQIINTTTADFVAPKIVVLGTHGGSMKLGTKMILPKALAGDTLDPNVTFTMTVTAPDKKTVRTTDGLLLNNVDPTKEYEIELTQYGQYKVKYEARDSFSGTKKGLQYAINVDDDKAPTIIFENAFQSTAMVGDIIGIPNFSVMDNVDAAEDITVTKYCVTPSGYIMTLSDKRNTVKTAQAGIYQFRIMVKDAAGNITMCRVNIVVKE